MENSFFEPVEMLEEAINTPDTEERTKNIVISLAMGCLQGGSVLVERYDNDELPEDKKGELVIKVGTYQKGEETRQFVQVFTTDKVPFTELRQNKNCILYQEIELIELLEMAEDNHNFDFRFRTMSNEVMVDNHDLRFALQMLIDYVNRDS